jgi:hypothetical protein
MSVRLSLDEAAAELRKTPRWLREWVRAHPRDKSGEAYYTPVGRDKLFHPSDIVRIELALREEVACRSVSDRRVPAKRRTTKSEDPTLASQLKRAAELTGDRSLLNSCERSKSASSSTASTPHQPRLRLIQTNQPS